MIILHFLLDYKLRLPDIFMKKVFYYILYSYNQLTYTTINLLPIKVKMTKCNIALLY